MAVIIDATQHHRERYSYVGGKPGMIVEPYTDSSKTVPWVRVRVAKDRTAGGTIEWREAAVTLTKIGFEEGDATEKESREHDDALRVKHSEAGKARLNVVARALEYLCGGKVSTYASASVTKAGGKLTINLAQCEELLKLLPPEDVAHALMVGKRKGRSS